MRSRPPVPHRMGSTLSYAPRWHGQSAATFHCLDSTHCPRGTLGRTVAARLDIRRGALPMIERTFLKPSSVIASHFTTPPSSQTCMRLLMLPLHVWRHTGFVNHVQALLRPLLPNLRNPRHSETEAVIVMWVQARSWRAARKAQSRVVLEGQYTERYRGCIGGQLWACGRSRRQGR